MRLVSFRSAQVFAGEPGRNDVLGVLVGERVIPTSAFGAHLPTSMGDLLARPDALDELRSAVAGTPPDGSALNLTELELLAPVPRPGKIVAVGLNYRSHAAEQDREAPDHPVLFAKFNTAVIPHGAEIRWDPRLTQAVDFEAELAGVIGRTCRRVGPSEALDYVLGYAPLNDVTARDLQYTDRQFVRGKSLDTFCPFGPALVTP